MAHSRVGDWTGRRVLVTGHSGFIGSWLCAMLVTLGADVAGYASDGDDHTCARAGWLAELGVTGCNADIRDLDRLSRAITEHRADSVIHLAAQPLVGVGYAEPYATLNVNVGGSLAVLEAVRRTGTAVLLHVTSDKCYRNRSWPWPYRENDELGGACPYSTSKAVGEMLFEQYARLYGDTGPRAASIRFGNVIGGGDFANRRLVPDCVRALAAGAPIELRHPHAVRPFQHVLDVVWGLLLLAEGLRAGRLGPGEVFNFAPPDQGTPVGRMVDALIASWSGDGRAPDPAPVLTSGSGTYPEESLLLLDGRKAAAALGWDHRLDIEAAGRWIADWHRSVGDGDGPDRVTLKQVHAFLALAGHTDPAARGGRP